MIKILMILMALTLSITLFALENRYPDSLFGSDDFARISQRYGDWEEGGFLYLENDPSRAWFFQPLLPRDFNFNNPNHDFVGFLSPGGPTDVFFYFFERDPGTGEWVQPRRWRTLNLMPMFTHRPTGSRVTLGHFNKYGDPENSSISPNVIVTTWLLDSGRRHSVTFRKGAELGGQTFWYEE